MKTYKVNYTKANCQNGTIIVKAENQQQAIVNSRNCCFTGFDFRNAVETTDDYVKPSLNGYQGRNRIN